MAVYKIKVEELGNSWISLLKARHRNSELEIRVIEPSLAASFSEDDFWRVIGLLDWSKEEDDSAGILEPAIAELSALDDAAIYRFQDLLSEKLFHLDQEVYARQLGPEAPAESGAFSADYFLYARACVVANGKEYYEAVLADPSQMPQGFTFEPLLSLARKAYFRKTGQPFDYLPPLSYETFSNPSGWEDALSSRLNA
jgi:hypothetical protein